MTERTPEQNAQEPETVLEVTDLKKHFPVTAGLFSKTVGHVYAVDGVSFTVRKGETLGLVGESGCGKSTVGKTIMRLIEPTDGSIKIRGKEITKVTGEALRNYRREMQIVFQDPYSSLNPRMTVMRYPHGEDSGELRDRCWTWRNSDRWRPCATAGGGLNSGQTWLNRYPFEFSGGATPAVQYRPGAVAGAEIHRLRTRPVSGPGRDHTGTDHRPADGACRKNSTASTYLFISHDLAVVEHISHRIAVMYLGKIVEVTDKTTLFKMPLHPYSEALLSAVPIPDPTMRRERIILQGDVPSPINPPSGCRFHTRCPYAVERCRAEEPPLQEVAPGHIVACHLRDVGAEPVKLERTQAAAVAAE